jgi:hypothetical protein
VRFSFRFPYFLRVYGKYSYLPFEPQSTPACIKALKAAKGNLNCNTIPQECKDLLTKAVNAGCCAPFIVQALGGPLPNLMACNMTFKPPMCAARELLSLQLFFSFFFWDCEADALMYVMNNPS